MFIHVVHGHGEGVGHEGSQRKGQQLVHITRQLGQQGAKLRPGAVAEAGGGVDNHQPGEGLCCGCMTEGGWVGGSEEEGTRV